MLARLTGYAPLLTTLVLVGCVPCLHRTAPVPPAPRAAAFAVGRPGNGAGGIRLTPLHESVARGDLDAVTDLVAGGMTTDLRDEGGATALHYATSADMVRLLVAHGADANARDAAGRTPIHYTSTREVASALLAAGADSFAPDCMGDPVLLSAVRNGRADVVEYLLHGESVSVVGARDGAGALHLAAQRGDEAMMRVLLAHAPDLEARDVHRYTPLAYAVIAGHEGAVRILLEAEASVQWSGKFGDTLLHLAAQGGHVRVLGILLERGLDPNARGQFGRTPVFASASEGHCDATGFLLEHGARLDTVDQFGQSPLHRPARDGRVAVCRLLLAHGADPTARDNSGAEGKTPLDLAEGNGQAATAALLREASRRSQ